MAENLQTASLENRVSFLEDKIKELELRLSRLEDPVAAINPNMPPQSSSVPNKHLSITLLNKNFHQAEYGIGDSGDRIDFTFQFTNHLGKDIHAFTGIVLFKDLFERVILRMGLTDESGLRSGGTNHWKGGVEYNQFREEHNRLLNIGKNDLIVEFLLERVIYTDGMREAFNE